MKFGRTDFFYIAGGSIKNNLKSNYRLFLVFNKNKVVQIPWVYADTEENGTPKLDENGNQMFTGYCMEFLHEMSKLLNFDYDVIPPTDNCRCYGEKQEDGTWTGLIGKIFCKIITGEILPEKIECVG